MKTHIYTKETLKEAADQIKKWEIVAFPTETVYGLWADAFNIEAIEKIYQVKGRPSDNPLIVHIASISQLENIAFIPEIHKNVIHRLLKIYWPGPLTLILPKKACVLDIVSGWLDTVAVRMPKNRKTLRLIQLSGTLLVGPSANLSGKPSSTKYQHVLHDFDGKIQGVILDSPTSIGIESSVLDFSTQIPTLLRPGSISLEELTEHIPELFYSEQIIDWKVKSPGMKYKHYSPQARIILFEQSAINKINTSKIQYEAEWKKVRVIFPETYKNFWKKLFDLFRDSDIQHYDIILIAAIDETFAGRAIMNRIRKATSQTII